MRTKLSLFFLCIILLLFTTSNAWASWAALTPNQAVSQADVILLGTVQGKVGEEKLADGLWTTEWKVQVSYYLKGKENAKEMIINTPGATGKSVQTSIDYPLDEKGNQVLLFLRHREGFYEPLSPQCVVEVDLKEISNKKTQINNAQQLVNQMKITKADYQPIEIRELKAILSKTKLNEAVVNTIIKPKYLSTWFSAKIVPALSILGAFVGILVGFLWLTRGKKPVK